MRLHLWVDGGCRPNPGLGAIGAVLKDAGGKPLWEVSRTIGLATNNVAEYSALIAGLEAARDLGATEVTAFMDSELVVRQMQGGYKVRQPRLQGLYRRARELAASFEALDIAHIPDGHNHEAHALVQRALNQSESGKEAT